VILLRNASQFSAGKFLAGKFVMRAIVAALATFSTPAMANSAANADISAPLRAAQATAPGQDGGDQQFRQLFSSWRAIEGGASFAAASSIANQSSGSRVMAIPSRMPLDGVRLTSDYGMRHHPVMGGFRMHKGIDLASPVGSPVYATADGVVGRADWFSSYGLYIQIEHGSELETRYGHLSRLNVAAGQMVHKGDLIGFVGTTGRSTGPHLHYEVRVGGDAVNPVPYLQGEGQPQLAMSSIGHAGALADLGGE
jgi:murein DD-endopeptidase MepM/ murein hydrolase activator NlpD